MSLNCFTVLSAFESEILYMHVSKSFTVLLSSIVAATRCPSNRPTVL